MDGTAIAHPGSEPRAHHTPGLSGVPFLAPAAGRVFIAVFEWPLGQESTFDSLATSSPPPPRASFQITDARGRHRAFCLYPVVDAGAWRVSFLHGRIDARWWREPVAVRRFHDQLRRVLARDPEPMRTLFAIDTRQRVEPGEPLGVTANYDGATHSPHVHVEVHRRDGYGEHSPEEGPNLDLSDPAQVLLAGRPLLDRALMQSRSKPWTRGLSHHFPAHPRHDPPKTADTAVSRDNSP